MDPGNRNTGRAQSSPEVHPDASNQIAPGLSQDSRHTCTERPLLEWQRDATMKLLRVLGEAPNPALDDLGSGVLGALGRIHDATKETQAEVKRLREAWEQRGDDGAAQSLLVKTSRGITRADAGKYAAVAAASAALVEIIRAVVPHLGG